MHLLDVNVWLGLAFKRHTSHTAALAWFRSTGAEPCCFCRLTQLGFLRLASNTQAMRQAAVTLQQAWFAYDALVADPRISYVDEPEGIDTILRSLTQHQSFSPKIWNDAYLAAFAQVTGLAVVTFDQGFSKYQSIRCTILS